MNEISPVKIDDGQLIEYEIEATDSEIKRLQRLLDEVSSHDVEFSNIFTLKHFDDKHAEADRKETFYGMNKVLKELYELGTQETKQTLRELNLYQPE